jgi:hypothetical protein
MKERNEKYSERFRHLALFEETRRFGSWLSLRYQIEL